MIQLKCPHCRNDDETMMELLGIHKGSKYYLCGVCIKNFGIPVKVKETNVNEVRAGDGCDRPEDNDTGGLPE